MCYVVCLILPLRHFDMPTVSVHDGRYCLDLDDQPPGAALEQRPVQLPQPLIMSWTPAASQSRNGLSVEQVLAQLAQFGEDDHVTAPEVRETRSSRAAKDRGGAADASILDTLQPFQPNGHGEAGNLPGYSTRRASSACQPELFIARLNFIDQNSFQH
jgi:hypothetical protein